LNRSNETLKVDIMEALRQVMVPDRGASVYDLDMVQDVEIEEDRIRLVFHPQAMLCSSMQVAFSIKSAVRNVSGMRKVEIHVVDYQRVCLTKREG
jgi:metal-sulfur cluster biosynthetic enzyme